MLDGIFGAETGYKWKRFDGTEYKYTNWDTGHPTSYESLVMFTSYDEKENKFGDISLSAASPLLNKVSLVRLRLQ